MSDHSLSVFGSAPPPKKEDVLFRAGEDWKANACMGNWRDGEWAYSSGFRRAGRNLAEQVCDSMSDQDVLVYPIVYLYRHHIELVLKAVIKSASALLERELSERELKTLGSHGLADLWETARPLLDPVCELVGNPPFPSQDLEGIDSYVRQLHEHDPDGQRFRYATTKTKRGGGQRGAVTYGPSLSEQLTLLNIRVFAEAMEKLADYLEGIEDWFAELRQQQLDMRS